MNTATDQLGLLGSADSAQGWAKSGLRSAVELPFTVSIVRTEEQLRRAVEIRSHSYGKHHPEVAEQLSSAEPADRARFSLVLLAESKKTGKPLGTLRIETNATESLPIEELLPPSYEGRGRTIAHVTRLAVAGGAEASLVKITLFKALHRYCLACQIDWIVVTALPPMDKQYTRLGFINIYEEETLIPISWSADIPMKLMGLEVISCERVWRRSQHPLYQFMFVDYCPDIQIFKSVSGAWATPRARALLPDMKQLDRLLGEMQ